MIYKIFFLLCFVFSIENFSCFGCNETKHLKFTTKKLENIAAYLQQYCEFPNCDSIMFCPKILKNKGIVFGFNKSGEINHLGVSLFSEETKKLMDIGICNFIERFLLELALINDNSKVESKLKELKISLFINGVNFNDKSNLTITDYIESIDMPVNFSLKYDEFIANAIWIYGSNTFNICFPLYRELIDGSDKKESDEILYNSLYYARSEPVNLMDENISLEQLEKYKENVYVIKGNVFLIPELTSNVYYIKSGTDYELLYSQEYPEISMNNLFLTYANGKGKILSLTHRRYGYFTPEITIPLLNFLNFFKDDFQIMCHTKYNKEDNLETIIVLNHKRLNYIHLMRVTAEKESLFSSNTILKADFYSNIPQHYIKTLLK